MTAEVVIFGIAAAGACLLAVVVISALALRRRPRRAPGGRGVLATLAVMFALLAASVAIVDDKVASGDSTKDTEASSVLEYPVTESDLAAFSSVKATSHRDLHRSLCLVAYFDDGRELGSGRSFKWWTSCSQNASFKTVDDVQRKLALPPDWGPRNARAIACVPVGAAMPYLRGPAAEQRSAKSKTTYRGGGLQYRVLRFDTDWIDEVETVSPAPAPLASVDAPCKK